MNIEIKNLPPLPEGCTHVEFRKPKVGELVFSCPQNQWTAVWTHTKYYHLVAVVPKTYKIEAELTEEQYKYLYAMLAKTRQSDKDRLVKESGYTRLSTDCALLYEALLGDMPNILGDEDYL